MLLNCMMKFYDSAASLQSFIRVGTLLLRVGTMTLMRVGTMTLMRVIESWDFDIDESWDLDESWD